jgi:hypothetical protein
MMVIRNGVVDYSKGVVDYSRRLHCFAAPSNGRPLAGVTARHGERVWRADTYSDVS